MPNSPTDRFGLNDYDQGDENWTHSDLVNFVDEHAVDSGPIADRPTSGTYDGEFYYATDESTLYRWDGSTTSWVVAAGAGTSSQPFPGTVYRESVSTDEINNTREITPGDWKSKIEDAASNVPDGGTIIVRSGTYTADAAAEISKNLSIVAPTDHSLPPGSPGDADVVIDRGSTDTTILDIYNDSQVRIAGLRFTGDDTGTQPAVHSRGTLYAYSVDGHNLGSGQVIVLDPDGTNYNVNGSTLKQVGGRQVDTVVTALSGSNNNDLHIEVAVAFNCQTAAVEAGGGSSSDIYVGQFEGSTTPTAGVILDGQRNKAFVRRVEMSEPGIEFNDASNVGIILYNVTGDAFTLNDNNNRYINISSESNWMKFASDYGGLKIDASIKYLDDATVQWGTDADFRSKYDSTSDTLKTKTSTNVLWEYGKSGGPGIPTTFDLGTKTPDFDGQLLRDDGTNFTAGEYAYADTGSGVWRAVSDPANLTVTY